MSIEDTLLKILERLGKDVPVMPSDLNVNDVPKAKGVYIWFTIGETSPAYIGKATGKAGLRGRVMRQHLNAKYLETRSSKITSTDQRQLRHGTTSNGKPAIEKSVFRKHLARLHDLAPGAGTINFIRANFQILLIPLPSLSGDEIRIVEDELVHILRPKLNVLGNRPNK